jgi:RES domain
LIPSVSRIRQDDTHRLIPSVAREESVFERLTEDDSELHELFELDGATNERLLGEANVLPGISVHELLFGVIHAHVVNAAFTHVHPAGSRFNGSERGAWYAAFEIETAEAEVRFHKAQELEEIHWSEAETFTFDDYLADFRAEFHDIRRDKSYALYLDPDRYDESQALAGTLLAESSAGIVYPSVRRKSGTCLVCFRPALVSNVRKGGRVTITFDNNRKRESKGTRKAGERL